MLVNMADSKLVLHDGIVQEPENPNVDRDNNLLFFGHLSFQSRLSEESERLFTAEDLDIDFRWRQGRTEQVSSRCNGLFKRYELTRRCFFSDGGSLSVKDEGSLEKLLSVSSV